MVLVKVPENRVDEFLDKFYRDSCMTFEGLDITAKESRELMEAHFRENGYTNDEMLCYWFSGNVMNDKYNLTNENRYRDELTFVVIPDFYNPVFKMMVGARWFADIVDGNAEREKEMRG